MRDGGICHRGDERLVGIGRVAEMAADRRDNVCPAMLPPKRLYEESARWPSGCIRMSTDGWQGVPAEHLFGVCRAAGEVAGNEPLAKVRQQVCHARHDPYRVMSRQSHSWLGVICFSCTPPQSNASTCPLPSGKTSFHCPVGSALHSTDSPRSTQGSSCLRLTRGSLHSFGKQARAPNCSSFRNLQGAYIATRTTRHGWGRPFVYRVEVPLTIG